MVDGPTALRSGVTKRLIARLLYAGGAVVPDAVLLTACYGPGRGRLGTLATLVSRLRQSLPGRHGITRVNGVGYKLDPNIVPLLPRVDARLLIPAPLPPREIKRKP